MRRVSIALTVLLMGLMTVVPSLADKYKNAETVTSGVYAKFRFRHDRNVYVATESNDVFSVTTRDGLNITVKPIGEVTANTQLIVRVVTSDEQEALNWFTSCTEDRGMNIIPFDIYFADVGRNRLPVTEGATAQLTLPDDYCEAIMYYLDTDGTATLSETSGDDEKISFVIKNNKYCVVAQRKPVDGDINFDGVINTGDAVIVLRAAAGMITLNSVQMMAADFNGDGTVNTGDASAILRYCAGLTRVE